MTVSSQQSYVEYNADGSTTTFPVPFYFLQGSDLVATVLYADGMTTDLAYGVDFSATGAGNQSGGSVTFNIAYPSGSKVLILRSPPATQETQYAENGKFPAKSHEKALDKLTMLIQRWGYWLDNLVLKKPRFYDNWYDALGNYIRNVKDPVNSQDAATKSYVDSYASNFNRTLRVPESFINQLPPVEQRKNKIIGMDDSGNPIMLIPQSGSASDVLLQLANPNDGSGADLVSFLQAGLNAIPRTVKSKLREYVDLEDFGQIDRSGETLAIATANTAVINRALLAAASLGKALRMSRGVIVCLPFGIPATLVGIVGRGKYATTIKFYRQSYAVGTILINGQYNTAGLELRDFSIDCDDAVFKVQYLAVLPITGTNNFLIDNLRIVGRGESAIVTQNSKNGRVYNYTCDCTGSIGPTDLNKTFSSAFYATNSDDILVVGMRTTGYPTYSGQIGTSNNCKFIGCHTDGTAFGFGYGFGLSSNCTIGYCSAKNTSHEAFQLSDTKYCTIAFSHAEWEGTNGQDAGMSIAGGIAGATTDFATMNLIVGNTFVNAYANGLMAAGNARYNLFAFNTLKDCGVRGTAAGSVGTNVCAMGQYTDNANQQCIGNKFVENTVVTEASPGVAYGYAEFNQGAGAQITATQLRNNTFYGTILTGRYLAPSAVGRIWDSESFSFAPTISSLGGGGVVTASVNSASFMYDGNYVDMVIDASISSATGSNTGLLIIYGASAPRPATYNGSFSGIEVASAKSVAGVPSGSGVAIRFYDGSNPATTGARIVVKGRYKVNQ